MSAVDRRTTLTLWQALMWTYAVQRAHCYLAKPVDWFIWALDVSARERDGPRPTVAFDAAQLHGEVLLMPKGEAEMLVLYSSAAMQPEVSGLMPRPKPLAPKRSEGHLENERWGWVYQNGERVDYVIRTAEIVSRKVARYAQVGRNRFRVTGYTRVREPVEYCPVEWVPEPSRLAGLQQIAAVWREIVGRLYEKVAEDRLKLRSHVIRGTGLWPLPGEAIPLAVMNARVRELLEQYPQENISVDTSRKLVAKVDHEGKEGLFSRRAKTLRLD